MPRISSPYDRMPRFSDGPIAVTPRLVAATLTTAPVPVLPLVVEPAVEELPASLAKRSAALAVCAVAVLGAVSTAAMLLPSNRTAAAQAEDLARKPITRPIPIPMPTGGPTFAIGRQLHHHHHHHWGRHHHPLRRHHPLRQAPVSAPQLTESTPTTSTTPAPSASATPTASSTPAPSQSSTPTPPAQTGPSGGGSLLSALSQLGSNAVLGSGTFTFNNFAGTIGAELPNGFSGQGENSTVLEMTPHSSSKGGLVPTAGGTTNPLIMLESQGGSPLLKDFTLQGTNQGHLYHGLRIKNTTNARVENVRVRAIPGDDKVNPGETFGIADFRSTGSTYSGVEVDGAGVGATGLGLNNSTDTTVSDSYFHDNPYSAGIAAWQSSNLTLTDVITKNNRTGLNFERVSGSVRIVRPTIEGNTAQDIYVGSDQGSAKITIIDPVFSGRLRIRIPSNYWAGPEQQRRSDIHVIINGVDRTNDVVQWL